MKELPINSYKSRIQSVIDNKPKASLPLNFEKVNEKLKQNIKNENK
jgi:hypothetical protein